jgi:cation diffusion facilitator CzcD-associated flavoprotein CzcO
MPIANLSSHTALFIFIQSSLFWMATMQDHYDVIIVGAGIQGLCAAHTFLTIDPSLSLLILDDKSSVGGVWAKEQLYPGLRANNLQGYYEFTDFPILEAGLANMGVSERGLLVGEALSSYVYKYAEYFGLLKRIQLDTKVLRAINNELSATKPWTLDIASSRGPAEDKLASITCDKLVVATGQASQPYIPSLPGIGTFQKPIFHSTQVAEASKSLTTDPTVANVTVIGGSKSAHDAVYLFATAGKRVTWLIRRSGRGAMPMAKLYSQMGPWEVWLEGLLMVRPLTWFGACPWSKGDGFGWIRWLLHGTATGRRLVQAYFAKTSTDSLEQSGILKDDKTKILLPDQSIMWYGTQISALNYDTDIYDFVRNGQVEVVREDLECLDGDELTLQTGKKIKSDALILATGYKYGPSFAFEPSDKQLSWGIPVPPSQDDMFPALDAQADIELFETFPALSSSPLALDLQPGLTPWRLWRFMAPPSQVCSKPHSLVFLSAITSLQTMIKCELTSLWAYAYLNDSLSVKPTTEADILYEAALWSRFGKWSRSMGMQGKIADFFLDSMPYYDLLLRDLGLRSWRKGWGIIGEVFGRWYELQDYKGVVDEWITKNRESLSRKKTV